MQDGYYIFGNVIVYANTLYRCKGVSVHDKVRTIETIEQFKYRIDLVVVVFCKSSNFGYSDFIATDNQIAKLFFGISDICSNISDKRSLKLILILKEILQYGEQACRKMNKQFAQKIRIVTLNEIIQFFVMAYLISRNELLQNLIKIHFVSIRKIQSAAVNIFAKKIYDICITRGEGNNDFCYTREGFLDIFLRNRIGKFLYVLNDFNVERGNRFVLGNIVTAENKFRIIQFAQYTLQVIFIIDPKFQQFIFENVEQRIRHKYHGRAINDILMDFFSQGFRNI